MTAPRRHGLVLVGVASALGLAIALQAARDRTYPRDVRQSKQMLYVRSGEALKRLTLSYDALAADVFWIRAIQHYGGDRLAGWRRVRKYELLYPLLDLTTTLDPYFNIAYRFGAIFLSEPSPGGPGRPDQAVALLRRAIAARPGRWQYYWDAAFVHYRQGDYAAAADWFRRGAAQPNAPNWLEPLAAATVGRGGDRATARFLWGQILQSDQPWLRGSAERSLLQLDALDRIDALEATIRSNPPSAGELYSWADLVRRRVFSGVPLDPAQTPFELDPVTGDVTVSQTSPLFPLPGDPRRPAP